MGLFDFFKKKKVKNSTATPMTNDAWINYLASRGYQCSAEKALQVAAVFRCIDIISKTMATLPFNLYKTTKNGEEKAKDHRLHRLLYAQPNKYTTRYEFMQMGIANLLLTRGMFVKIERDRNGFIKALWNIPTNNCSQIYINSATHERYVYVTTDEGQEETLYEDEFMFIPSFKFSDNVNSEDPMYIAANVLGLVNSADRMSKASFNGDHPGGYITYPGGLSEDAYERLKTSFNENYAGAQNAGKFMLLEEGGSAKQFEVDMEKMQVLETKKFLISEVCRIFGVPPHMCMDMEHATFSNIEQQSLEFVRDCINTYCVRLEQAFYKDCLTEREKDIYFFKFNLNSLLRGDTATRTQYYHTMRQDGIMNADEIRELEDMNKIEGGIGQVYCINGNMIPLSSVPENIPKGAMNKNAK